MEFIKSKRMRIIKTLSELSCEMIIWKGMRSSSVTDTMGVVHIRKRCRNEIDDTLIFHNADIKVRIKNDRIPEQTIT